MAYNQKFNRLPTRWELMNPVLVAVRSLGGSATIKEITNQVIADLDLPSHLAEIPHGKGSQTKLEYNLAWARTNLKEFGLIVNSGRAVWSLTSKGHETETVGPQSADTLENPLVIPEELEAGVENHTDLEQRPVEDATVETAVWRDSLLDILLEMPFDSFERLCRMILRESGFIEVEVTGKSGDGGIDGHGTIRLAGLISFPVLFQCKRYSGSVSASAVRDFRGAMQGRADKGLILTTGSFTSSANKEATRDGVPPIDLIDGRTLVELLKELQLGVNRTMVEVVEIDENWFKSI